MTPKTINITKTTKGFFSFLGIGKKKQSIVLQISESGLFYNSTLGNIGLINPESIISVELGKAQSSDVIKIETADNFYFKSKLSKFRQKMSELYKKETGAEILIFPQDVDMDLKELNELIKSKLKK